jgi:hypothetical protein
MQEYIRDNENNINWKWSFNVEMCTSGMPDKPLELWNSHFSVCLQTMSCNSHFYKNGYSFKLRNRYYFSKWDE